MSTSGLPDGLEGPLGPKQAIPSIKPAMEPEKEEPQGAPSQSFEKFMQPSTASTSTSSATQTQEISPLSAAPTGDPPTVQSLNNGINSINGQVDDIQKSLTPGAFNTLSPADKALLQTKTAQFNNSADQFSSRLGVADKGERPAPLSGSLESIISWFQKGQSQLTNVAQNMQGMDADKISPATLLQAQANLNAAQRAVNLVSAIAGKAVDAFKTLMQTQI